MRLGAHALRWLFPESDWLRLVAILALQRRCRPAARAPSSWRRLALIFWLAVIQWLPRAQVGPFACWRVVARCRSAVSANHRGFKFTKGCGRSSGVGDNPSPARGAYCSRSWQGGDGCAPALEEIAHESIMLGGRLSLVLSWRCCFWI
jgi:hypothetical protein